MTMNGLGTVIPLRRRCYLSLKEIEGRFQIGGTSSNKSNKDCKLPVAATDSSTLFLEELEVEHHQDTTSQHDYDEESQPEQDHEAFEVIPYMDEHDDMRKKKKGHHLWKKIHRKMGKLKIVKLKMVSVLKKLAEDHNIMNVNHKSDVAIIVPSVPSQEPVVDNVNSEEEVDKATNDSEKIPKVLPVTQKKEVKSFLKVVLESGETEVTPLFTTMKTTESSIAPTIESTSTGTGSSTMGAPAVLVNLLLADNHGDNNSHTSVPPIDTLSLQSNTSKNQMSHLSAPTNTFSSCGSHTKSCDDTSTTSSSSIFSMEDTVRDVSARQDTDTLEVVSYTPMDGAITRSSSGIDNQTLMTGSWNSYLAGLTFDHDTLVPGEIPIAPGCHVSWNDMTDLWETMVPCRSRQHHPPIHTADSMHSMGSISALTDPNYSRNPILQLG
eukprot:scaffold686979_cov71-Attheya_sp.AAC.2